MAIAKATFEELVSRNEETVEAAEMGLLKRRTQNDLRQTYLRTQEQILDVEGMIGRQFGAVRENGLDAKTVLDLTARLRTLKEVESDTEQLWSDLFPREDI